MLTYVRQGLSSDNSNEVSCQHVSSKRFLAQDIQATMPQDSNNDRYALHILHAFYLNIAHTLSYW